MERWYVLSAAAGREYEAAKLLEQSVSRDLWSLCCIPQKMKVFRSGGILHLLEGVMFPGYIFIRTQFPKQLCESLERARKLPQFISSSTQALVPVEEQDLRFLQDVCGKNLQQTMGVTKLHLSNENKIIGVDGILKHYLDRIVKLNLHKRYAVVEVELFNRKQEVLFGLQLDQDQAG